MIRLSDAAGFQPGLNGATPAWLRATREQAAQRFAELGLPTRRDEQWRLTSIKPIADTEFAIVEEAPAVTAE